MGFLRRLFDITRVKRGVQKKNPSLFIGREIIERNLNDCSLSKTGRGKKRITMSFYGSHDYELDNNNSITLL